MAINMYVYYVYYVYNILYIIMIHKNLPIDNVKGQ